MDNGLRAQVLRQFDGNWDDKTIDGYLQWQPYCLATLWSPDHIGRYGVAELLDVARERAWNLPVPRRDTAGYFQFDPHFWFARDRTEGQEAIQVVAKTCGWARELADRGVPPVAVLLNSVLWQRALSERPQAAAGLVLILQAQGIAMFSGRTPISITPLAELAPVVLTSFQQEALDQVKSEQTLAQWMHTPLGGTSEQGPFFLTAEWHARCAAWHRKRAVSGTIAAQQIDEGARIVERIVKEYDKLVL